MVVISGDTMTAGSKLSFSATTGSRPPMSWDRMTVQISVRQTTAATGGAMPSRKISLAKLHGHAADDGGGTLAARVAARVGQHRDVGGQHGHGGEGVLIPADDHAGEG